MSLLCGQKTLAEALDKGRSMGFLKTHAGVEAWLRFASSHFEPMSQAKYTAIVREWRFHFDALLRARHFREGRAAEEAIEQTLPCDVFVFSIPGYPLLPASTDPRLSPAYGYEVSGLRDVDLAAANEADAMITNRDFSFAYLGTHEAGVLAHPQFCESR
jgi:hypothetical protein